MIKKLKNLTKMKSFHISMIMVIIVVLFFSVGVLALRYIVEGETNMPFELTKISIISSQEGIDNGEVDTKWSFDIYQSNDIYIYIDKNKNYNKTEIIKSVKIENFFIDKKNIENIKFYKPDAQEEKIIYKYKEENIVESIEYTGDVKADIKNLKISNQGGIITFRCSNNNVGKYKSNDEVINHEELLKKSNININDLKMNISFDLTIVLESGKEYQTNVMVELPSGNVVENGITTTEITNLNDVIFKRK